MPVKSKKQFRFMQAVAHGYLKNKPEGLSKREAKEFINETTNYKTLPETASKRKFKTLEKMRK